MTEGGWRPVAPESPRRLGLLVAASAVMFALLLLLPASLASGCSDPGYCDDFSAIQVASRAVLQLAPIWMLVLLAIGAGFRPALVVFLACAVLLVGLAFMLGGDTRFMLRPLGLSTANGFAWYGLPFAVAAVGALFDLRQSRNRARRETKT